MDGLADRRVCWRRKRLNGERLAASPIRDYFEARADSEGEHMCRRGPAWWFVVLLTVLWSVSLAARQSEDFGTYIVYYSAVLTEAVAPSAADAHGIQHGRDRGLLNLAVERKSGERPFPSVAAEMRVRATNLAGQLKEVEMRPVESGDYIYYIGTFPVAPREVVNFEIEVRPEGADQSFRVQFQRRFVTAGLTNG